jgi:signal transduction histidine kinase/DNA-binding response OmpR family regulator
MVTVKGQKKVISAVFKNYVVKINLDGLFFGLIKVIIKNEFSNKKIDFIFTHTDFIAKDIIKLFTKKIKLISVDGLMGKNMGLDMVIDKQITATILYPTGGRQSIKTAMNILENRPYEKETKLETIIIDSSNIDYFIKYRIKVNEQKRNNLELQNKIKNENKNSEKQKFIIFIISITLSIAFILICLLIYLLNLNRRKNLQLKIKREKIIEQKDDLILLNSKIDNLKEARLDYFTKFTHELRTPLTLILAPLEDAVKSQRLHFTLKNNLELCLSNAKILEQIIDQIMDFRKIESGKMKLNLSRYNIGIFIHSIVNNFNNNLKNKNISLNIKNSAPNLEILYDEKKMSMVLYNLLSNAVKFSKDHGTINISIQVENIKSIVVIKIEDNGIGMSEIDTQHVFELFYQGHHIDFHGSGIGLSIAKEIILLHKGTIEVSSKKDIGTCFTVCLPLIKERNIDSRYVTEETKFSFLNNNLIKLNKINDEYDELNFNDKQSILIIEDNEDIKIYLKNKFTPAYDIHTANDGNSGIKMALDIIPDIIITDIIMPNGSGLKISELLKNDLRTSHIPIIILTSKTSLEDQIQGMKVKADAFITKPFNFEFLEETIKNLLRNRIILRDHYTSNLPIETRSNSLSKLDKKFISTFTNIVEKHLSNSNLTIELILNEMNISKVQLYRKVKALIGYNVNDYILSVRIQKAKYLLQDENFSISEIAYQVGFTSQGYFSTVFKSKVEVTPSEYREKRN